MAKKDYVLEKALTGDLDAIENILGQVYAPLFDLGYHVFGRVEPVLAELRPTLVGLGRQLESGKLEASSPFQTAARLLIGRLDTSLPPTFGEGSPLLAGRGRRAGLALLAYGTLDLEGADLDEAMATPPGRALAIVEETLDEMGIDIDDFRDRLDEVSAGIPLPEGLIDEVRDILED